MFIQPSNRLLSGCIVLLALLIGACASDTPSSVSVYDSNPDARPEPVTTFKGRTTIVKAGDNLYSIAFEAGFDTADVARWNNMNQDDTILIGQEIRLYPPNRNSPTFSGAESKTIPAKNIVAPTQQLNSPSKWIWPTQGEVISKFSAQHQRNGIHIAGESGTPVSAAASGRVVYAGSGLIGFGRIIIVKHSEEFLSVYAHNSRIVVNEGDSVQQGQKIAEMGSTDADRVKLHFEIRQFGKPVDPIKLLSTG